MTELACCIVSGLTGFILARHLIPTRDILPYCAGKDTNDYKGLIDKRKHFRFESTDYILFNYTTIYLFVDNRTFEKKIWTIGRIKSSSDVFEQRDLDIHTFD